MFSRRQKGHQRSSSWNLDSRRHYDTPLDELVASLDRVEEIVEKARSEWVEETQNPIETPPSSGGFAASFRSRRSLGKKEEETPEKQPTKLNKFLGRKEQDAKFIAIAEQDELVELLRRLAELVILGEKAVAVAEVQEEQKRAHRRQHSDGKVYVPKPPEKPNPDTAANAAMFERFFERNALSLIVNIATGVAFDQNNDEKSEGDLGEIKRKSECTLLLPPLPIATQAVQSVSILIQNVSRATSLYFLLSNNHINELIDLPLELYSVAERNERDSPRRGSSGSPEIAELTTHFVSFLKSLAMRMNVETLQFFLTYPSESADFGHDTVLASSAHFHAPCVDEEEDGPMDEVRSYRNQKSPVNQPVPVQAVKVEFPLYRRSLEFCAAHQDSFVRLTAMNVCLNTLRLATVSPTGHDGEHSQTREKSYGSSPDGVLHNAKPLPLKERLAIAQHVCAPARVAGLVSPVFTKLAELWGMLEEYFRELDSIQEGSSRAGSGTALDDRRRTAKVEKARDETRRRRVVSNFHDAAASIQDELLMLEDVLKVGLTSLNEQVIEMMMATFVYPLLLQPLLMYMQTLPSADESSTRYGMCREGSDSFSAELTTRRGKDTSKSSESAPAKTALFSLASVFHFITNRPLLRLLLTALLHPLAPDATAETVIQAKPDVACAGPHGTLNVRVDEVVPDPCRLISDERRFSYSFGEVTGQRSRIYDSSPPSQEEDICVFVLSPALAFVLEGRSGNLSTIVKTRRNPYRRSILRCLVDGDVSLHMRQLSLLTVDAAASKFDGKFLGDLIFGGGMKTYGDEMPMDERRVDSRNAYVDTNRNIGGGSNLESRRAFKRDPTSQDNRIDSNPTLEVIAPLCVSVVTASSGLEGSWSLEYDGIAAHALLCTSRGNVRATETAAKLLESRKRQAAAFLAKLPTEVDISDVQSTFLKAPTIEEEDEMRTGMAMDHMVYDPVRQNGRSMIEELLVRFKDRGKLSVQVDYSVPISLESSFIDLSKRACYGDMESQTSENESTIGSASNSVFALFQLGKRLYLLLKTNVCVLFFLTYIPFINFGQMRFQDSSRSYQLQKAAFCEIESWEELRYLVQDQYWRLRSFERRIPIGRSTIPFQRVYSTTSFIKEIVIMGCLRPVPSLDWSVTQPFPACVKSPISVNRCSPVALRVWWQQE